VCVHTDLCVRVYMFIFVGVNTFECMPRCVGMNASVSTWYTRSIHTQISISMQVYLHDICRYISCRYTCIRDHVDTLAYASVSTYIMTHLKCVCELNACSIHTHISTSRHTLKCIYSYICQHIYTHTQVCMHTHMYLLQHM